MMKDALKKSLKACADFNEAELEEIADSFKPRSVRKKSVLLHEGSTCKEFYFIQSGCLRTFFIDESGGQRTRHIMLDDHLGTALTSFISQTPSFEAVDAVGDTELLYISYLDFFRFMKEMEHWNFFYQKFLERAYMIQNKIFEQLVTRDARHRYHHMLKETPNLIQRLPNRVLASYLNIREETLSRIKGG